ncbi:MAG: hypothetical protein A2W08_15165 [Candidatus Rokubacteria bacterium RBG_16_73_20]|nr:MAG: hypothetical protein A2W08_15165 [Candidatus Rokubacteria bacterium RBG_16_73_20]
MSIPLMTNDHQSQLPAMPCFTVSPVTASGVSAAKVVATIEVPASHQGIERPDRKYSVDDVPARPENTTPTTSERAK